MDGEHDGDGMTHLLTLKRVALALLSALGFLGLSAVLLASPSWAHEGTHEAQPADTGALAPSQPVWDLAAPTPLGRFEAGGATAGGKLYVFGGYYTKDARGTARSDVYDPATNSWRRIADMPEPLTHHAVVADGTSLYVVGGFVGDDLGPSTAHVWRYDTLANAWSAGPSLPARRGAGGAAIVGRTIHFFGGVDRPAGTYLHVDEGEHWALNLDNPTPSWVPQAPLPNPRNHLAGASLDGKVYALGGQHGKNATTENQGEVDVYDSATDAWTRAANLPAPRGHVTASAFDLNGRVFLVGGVLNDRKASSDVTSYDPLANAWSAHPSLPAPRITPVADAVNDKIVVATGDSDSTPRATTTTWIGGPSNVLPTDTILTSGPSGSSRSSSAVFSFYSFETGSTYECSLDGASFAPCASPKSYAALSDRSHTFRVRTIDSVGRTDATPASRTWTVDTKGPSIFSQAPSPGSRTQDRTPAIGAIVRDAATDLSRSNIQMYVDGRKITTFGYYATTDRLIYTPRLDSGYHTVKIFARDSVGNAASAGWGFRVVE